MSERIGISEKKAEVKGRSPASTKSQPGLSPVADADSSVEGMLHLQRTIGNRAVTRLIESGTLQGRLTVGAPNDVYEQEADRIADRVMAMVDTDCPECSDREPEVQRQAIEEEPEEVQAKPVAGEITPLIQRQPEPEETEEEPVQAQTFTTNRDIMFRSGQYPPLTLQQRGDTASAFSSQLDSRLPRLRSDKFSLQCRSGGSIRGRKKKKKICCPKSGFPKVTHTGKSASATHPKHSFDMEVEYERDGTVKGKNKCNVGCCEFRQVIKGYLKVNGVKQTLKSSGSGLTINEKTYVDDGYTNADDQDSSKYKFKTDDNPGLRNATSTQDLDYYLNFEARVIDTCRSNKIIARKTGYWIKIKGKHPRTLTEGGF